jgi:hypothetical protein
LVFLCAGDKSLYEDAGEALDEMGKKSCYFLKIVQGAQMKLVVNMVMGTIRFKRRPKNCITARWRPAFSLLSVWQLSG